MQISSENLSVESIPNLFLLAVVMKYLKTDLFLNKIAPLGLGVQLLPLAV
jgi:hypothetical protein